MREQPGRLLAVILLVLFCWQFSGVSEGGSPRMGPDSSPVHTEDQLPVEAEIDEFAEAENGEDEDRGECFAADVSPVVQNRHPVTRRAPDGPIPRPLIVPSFLFRPPATA